MGLLSLRRKQLIQPYYQCPLDESHWAYSNLVFAYSTGRGIADGKFPSNFGSHVGSVNRGVGEKGRNVVPANSTSYVNFPHRAEYNVLGEISIIALIKPTSSIAQQGIATKCETSGGANTPFGFFVDGLRVSLNRANTGGGTPYRVWASAATITADTNVVIAATQGADIGVDPKFYINGTFDTGAASALYGGTVATGAPTGNTTSLKIGNRTDLLSQSFHSVYDVLVFNRILSASEIKEISNNIWAVWEAESYNIFIADTASNTYTITPSGGITLAGAGVFAKTKVMTPTGGVTLSGSTSFAGTHTYLITPSGGTALAGSAALIKTRIQIPTGGIAFSGSAPIDSNTVIVIPTTQLLLTGVGK